MVGFKQSFKEWLEDDVFSQKEKTQKSNISKILGFKKELFKVSEGTFATLYQHPKERNKLIKVTSHKEDVVNLARSQNIKSENIVKLFPWNKKEIIKKLPDLNSYAIIVEKIIGSPMKYSTSEFYDLSLRNFEKAKDWLLAGGNQMQNIILSRHEKNTDEEKEKLANLFGTLYLIKKFYKIDLVDFQDNILETNERYVLIDMGY